MAEKTVAEKLRLKPGMGALILDAPPDVLPRLGIPSDVTLLDDPATADFLLVFVDTQAEAEAKAGALAPAVGDKTVAWIAYPKGSKAAGHDLNRDTAPASSPPSAWSCVPTSRSTRRGRHCGSAP